MEQFTVCKRHKTIHRLIHYRNITVAPSAVIQIYRSIAIFKQMGVDRLRSIDKFSHKRPAKISAERAFRAVGKFLHPV